MIYKNNNLWDGLRFFMPSQLGVTNTVFDIVGNTTGSVISPKNDRLAGPYSEKGKSINLNETGNGTHVLLDDAITKGRLDNITSGTVAFSARVTVAGASDEKIAFSICPATGSRTEFVVDLDMRVASVRTSIFLAVDGTRQWQIISAVNSLLPYIQRWINILITHDGSDARLYINGRLITTSYVGSPVDQTKWLKSIINDASNKANKMLLSGLFVSGTRLADFNGRAYNLAIWDRVLKRSEIGHIARTHCNALLEKHKRIFVVSLGRLSRYHNLNGLGGQGQLTWNPLG